LLITGQRAAARQHVLERLAPADAGKRIAKHGLDKLQNAEGRFTVGLDPVLRLLVEFLWCVIDVFTCRNWLAQRGALRPSASRSVAGANTCLIPEF
jgi:hypothetical protein